VNPRHIARFLGAAVATTTFALLSTPVPSASAQPPSASAQPCPDVELVFARGTYEPPGLGGTGQAFADALRSQVGARSLGVYAVNYPASTDFPTGLDGIRDASAHIRSTAANCPKTKMVLGGFSQGAAVMGFVTSDAVPDGAPDDVPDLMPPEVADHVTAVVLFGKPSNQFMNMIGQPPVAIGPLYAAKTLDLCIPNDPICAGEGDGFVHTQYGVNGMVSEAAAFAVGRL
jgi:cutinase